MTLALPDPPPLNARTHRHASAAPTAAGWTAARSRAREQWPPAARAYEQAADLVGDAAYALAAAHAAIKAGQSRRALARLQRLRKQHRELTIAYTLESHAQLELGRAADAVAVLQALPARRRATTSTTSRWRSRCSAAAGTTRPCIAFMQALALKIDDAVAHFRLGMSFKDLGMKAEAAECVRTALAARPGHQRAVGARAARLPGARGLPLGARREAEMAHAARCRARRARRRGDRDRRLRACRAGGRSARATPRWHRSTPATWQRRCAALPRRAAKAHAGRLRIGYLSADFHQHATSQLMVQMFESHDRERFEVTLFSAGARRWQRDAPAHRRRGRTLRRPARPHHARRWRAASANRASTSWST